MLHDGHAPGAGDHKRFLSLQGNGGWQLLTLQLSMAKADGLTLHLFGDMFTSTSASGTSETNVVYDDIQVVSSLRGTVLNESFESGLSLTQDPRDPGGWYSCGQRNTVIASEPRLQREVVYLGGLAIAEMDDAGIHELHADHLGTPRIITNAATKLIEGRQAFAPYGERLDGEANTSGYVPLTGFTGHIQTDATGLIYMRARYYSPAWHRFINSDRGADSLSPHQFAYAGGSPLQVIDPTGMAGETVQNGAVTAVGDPAVDEADQKRRLLLFNMIKSNYGTANAVMAFDWKKPVSWGGLPLIGGTVIAPVDVKIEKAGWAGQAGFRVQTASLDGKFKITLSHQEPGEQAGPAGTVVRAGDGVSRYADPSNGNSTGPHVDVKVMDTQNGVNLYIDPSKFGDGKWVNNQRAGDGFGLKPTPYRKHPHTGADYIDTMFKAGVNYVVTKYRPYE